MFVVAGQLWWGEVRGGQKRKSRGLNRGVLLRWLDGMICPEPVLLVGGMYRQELW